MKTNKVTKKDLNRVFARMQLLNVTNNYESMQAIGFLASFVPVLERLYNDRPKEEKVTAMKRHLQFFNSHVNSDALILGVAAAVEESTTEEEKDVVVSVKTGLMGPLAGLGDSILKFTWLPICGSIGASLALQGSILGPILMFLLYNAVNVATKYYGIHIGYEKGMSLIQGSGIDFLKRIGNMANVVGLMVVGALISSSVKVKTVLEFGAGENIIKLQDLFDKVMPSLLGFLITIAIYFILKKTNGKHAPLIIAGTMVLCVVLKTFGIL